MPIVAMTAYAMKDDRDRCRDARMDAYVSKPADRVELYRVIDGFFGASPPEVVPESDHAGSTDDVFDRNQCMARVAGDIEVLKEIVEMFFEQTPKLLSTMGEAIRQGDRGELERTAHSLKSSVGHFGARRAFELALKLETMGHDGELNAAEEVFRRLEKEIERLRDALAEWSDRG